MAAAQKAGAKGAEEPIMPPIMEPSAEDPSAKKSKKRKVAEAQALEAQAAEADANTPAGVFPLRLHPSSLAVCQTCGIPLQHAQPRAQALPDQPVRMPLSSLTVPAQCSYIA